MISNSSDLIIYFSDKILEFSKIVKDNNCFRESKYSAGAFVKKYVQLKKLREIPIEIFLSENDSIELCWYFSKTLNVKLDSIYKDGKGIYKITVIFENFEVIFFAFINENNMLGILELLFAFFQKPDL